MFWIFTFINVFFEMSCNQLSKAFLFLANKGGCMKNTAHLAESQVKRINAIMLTCGYTMKQTNLLSRLAYQLKAVLAVVLLLFYPTDHYIVSTWSPGLNKKGNFLLGMQALEQFSTKNKTFHLKKSG